MESQPCAVVLLAAGESTRMGQPKQLLQWRGLPLVQYQVQEIQATGVSEIVVVLGYGAEQLQPLVEQVADPLRTHVVLNPEYREGKTTSIKAGLSALRTRPAVVIPLAVDQPRPRGVLQRLVDEHVRNGNLISVPLHKGRHGHPPVFAGSLIPDLLEITEVGQGIRAVINRHQDALREVAIDDPIVLTNINTTEDYQRALLAGP